jgi:ABC-2 type transport system ATP-binding protein
MRTGRIVDRDTPAQLLARYGRQNMEYVFLDIARADDDEAAVSGGGVR